MRNSIKVVYNPIYEKVSFYLKNERGIWVVLSSESPLSKQCFSDLNSVFDNVDNMIKILNETYNRNDRGLDIYVYGDSSLYNLLNTRTKVYKTISIDYRDISIAFMGRVSSGKTTLIDAISDERQVDFEVDNKSKYIEYYDKFSDIHFFEISGIEISNESIQEKIKIIRRLGEQQLSHIIYCISAESGRIENSEIEIIQSIKKEFPFVQLMIVLTLCIQDDNECMNQIKKVFHDEKVICTVAKDYVVRGGKAVVPAFGVEKIVQYIYEGRI